MSRRTFLMSATKTFAASALSTNLPDAKATKHLVPEGSAFHSIDRLHQIAIVDGFGVPKSISKITCISMQKFRDIYQFSEYTLWTGEMLRTLIADYFGRAVLSAFDAIKPYAYKTDLARYCVLYLHGGLYSDMNVLHTRRWCIEKCYRLGGFSEKSVQNVGNFTISGALLWSQPLAPTLELAIHRILENAHMHNYGKNVLDPTGCALLGRAWLETRSKQQKQGMTGDQSLGRTKVYRSEIGVGWTFSSSSQRQEVVASQPVNRPGGAHYIFEGSDNDYVEMWWLRCVYGER